MDLGLSLFAPITMTAKTTEQQIQETHDNARELVKLYRGYMTKKLRDKLNKKGSIIALATAPTEGLYGRIICEVERDIHATINEYTSELYERLEQYLNALTDIAEAAGLSHTSLRGSSLYGFDSLTECWVKEEQIEQRLTNYLNTWLTERTQGFSLATHRLDQ